jgi:hypothetical protein
MADPLRPVTNFFSHSVSLLGHPLGFWHNDFLLK